MGLIAFNSALVPPLQSPHHCQYAVGASCHVSHSLRGAFSCREFCIYIFPSCPDDSCIRITSKDTGQSEHWWISSGCAQKTEMEFVNDVHRT